MPDANGLLAGKVILVTGASRGIGAAACQLFGHEGATVVATARDEEALKTVTERIEEAGGTGSYLVSDIAEPGSAATAVRTVVERYGRLDGAFNNAGLGQSEIPTADISDDDFDLVTTINMRSVWSFMRSEISALLRNEEGGAIVNNSSLAGFRGNPGGAGYAATKHGVVGLTKTAAGEYGQSKIRVNAIAPGTTGTEMIYEWDRRRPGAVDAVVARSPLRRMADPVEIAQAALWLLSDRSSYVNGVLLPVDGGLTAVV